MIANKIVAPSIQNAIREIADFLACRGMLIFYFWELVGMAVVSGIMRENFNVVAGFIIGFLILVAIFVWMFLITPYYRFLRDWLFQGDERTDAFQKAFKMGKYKQRYDYNSDEPVPDRTYLLILTLLFGIIPMLCSTIIQPSLGKIAVVGNMVLPIDSTHAMTSPFAPVTWIQRDNKIFANTLTAKTSDGVTVTANIEANLSLSSDRNAAMIYASKKDEIDKQLNNRLASAFEKVIKSHTLETLPNDLLILSHLVHQESLDILGGLPLVWNGEFSVSKPKLIYKQ